MELSKYRALNAYPVNEINYIDLNLIERDAFEEGFNDALDFVFGVVNKHVDKARHSIAMGHIARYCALRGLQEELGDGLEVNGIKED